MNRSAVSDSLQCDAAEQARAVRSDEDDPATELRVTESKQIEDRVAAIAGRFGRCDHPSRDLRWLLILQEGLRQRPLLIEAVRSGRTVGYLPLSYVSSLLFGRYLVSLPYVNSAGINCDEDHTAGLLIAKAAELTDQLDCRFLELRHEMSWSHPVLNAEMTGKVHMRLPLPKTVDDLWSGLKSKVRSQIRKGQRQGFTVHWGGIDLLNDFYDIFSRRMRDLGTPVFSRRLFTAILRHFAGEAELCCLRDGSRPIAAALLIHGKEVSEVTSASSLVKYNPANANMLMYWHLLERAVGRGQRCFDFGRSSRDSNTFRFKKQWGAEPEPAVWQYYVRQGTADALRPDNTRNQRLIRLWKKLPVRLTRWLGPTIVRGIP